MMNVLYICYIASNQNPTRDLWLRFFFGRCWRPRAVARLRPLPRCVRRGRSLGASRARQWLPARSGAPVRQTFICCVLGMLNQLEIFASQRVCIVPFP